MAALRVSVQVANAEELQVALDLLLESDVRSFSARLGCVHRSSTA
jgi:hypothetical protein